MEKLTYEHVSFDIATNAAKTEAAFVEHEAHVGLSEAQLREAHGLITEAAKPKPVVVEAPADQAPEKKNEGGSIPVQYPALEAVGPKSFVVGDAEVHLQ